MADVPTFSVIIPVFNRASTISATLESVRTQTYRGWECLVVDDGSDDGEDLWRVVQGLNDTRFKYLHRENGGPSAARNTGIVAASGKFVAFLDSDDMFLPNKLEVMANIVHLAEKVAFYSFAEVRRSEHATWIRPSRPIRPGEAVAEYLFVSNEFIPTLTLVVPTSLAKKVLFDPTLRQGEDPDLCVRLAHEGVKFQFVNKVLGVWVDTDEENRASRHGDHLASRMWLERSRHLLGQRAVYGYKATVLAYLVAPTRPLAAARYLLQGALLGRVPIGVVLRQATRSFLPRPLYRRLVDWYIQVRRQTPASV